MTPDGKLPRLLRKYPNLYGDLSAASGRNALKYDPDFVLTVIKEFQDRLLFARDCFHGKLYEFLSGLELPEETAEKIFYKNAVNLIA